MTPNDAVQKLRCEVLEIESVMDVITELIEANRELAGQVIDLKRERDEARRIAIEYCSGERWEKDIADLMEWPSPYE